MAGHPRVVNGFGDTQRGALEASGGAFITANCKQDACCHVQKLLIVTKKEGTVAGGLPYSISQNFVSLKNLKKNTSLLYCTVLNGAIIGNTLSKVAQKDPRKQ